MSDGAGSDDIGALLPAMVDSRERFLALVGEVRPELHRYCARMTGSVFDGEDVVQDTLAKAHYALGQMTEPPSLRPWLFRIAHNTAMDFVKRYEHRHVQTVADVPEVPPEAERAIDPALVEAALAVFVSLPPQQRSALVLKDVLGHSLEQIADAMGTSVAAVKSLLSRARAGIVRERSAMSAGRAWSAEEQANLQRYADLFDAGDWDSLRALVGEESRLELISRREVRGPKAADYFTRYAQLKTKEGLRPVRGRVDGVPAIAFYRGAASTPAYFVLFEWDGARLARIRDYYYVPYIAELARFVPC